MPRPQIYTNMSRYYTVTGWTSSCATCVRIPFSKTSATGVFQEFAPASVSNPVRVDRTRAPRSYSRHVAIMLPPRGKAMNQPSSPSSSRVYVEGPILGDAFTRGYKPNHSVALRLLNESRMKALGELSKEDMQFNVAAVEARSTMKGVTKFASKGVSGLLNVQRTLAQVVKTVANPSNHNRRRAEQLLNTPPYNWRDVPSDYLGWLYGLRPLAEDIEGGLLKLSGMAREGLRFEYWTRKGRHLSESMLSPVSVLGLSGVEARLAGTRKSFASVGYRYRFPEWWIQSVPTLTPFSQAWELTRLSFVLDWILPVGDWVSALEAQQFDPYFYEGYETYGTDEVTRDLASVTPGWNVVLDEAVRLRRYEFVRRGLSDVDNPVGLVKFPSFRNYLGVNHAAQGLSLFAQMMSSPPNRWAK